MRRDSCAAENSVEWQMSAGCRVDVQGKCPTNACVIRCDVPANGEIVQAELVFEESPRPRQSRACARYALRECAHLNVL